MTTFVIDAHVHLYPGFSLDKVVYRAWCNFSSLHTNPTSVKFLLLTERSDCTAFAQIKKQKSIAGFTVQDIAPEAIRLHDSKQRVLYIMAGRQIVTAESLEVCCLVSTFNLPDRQFSTVETIRRVNQAGGVAALNWAPGKWLFKRGKLVARLLDEFTPEQLLIGDTSMRPDFWTTPRLMKQAMRKSFRIVAGSDPLPFKGEEENIGRYVCSLEAPWQEDRPVESLRMALIDPKNAIRRLGRRSATLEFIGRQVRIMQEKKNREA